MEKPDLSVVIPTYQGANRVVRTLGCLSTQVFKSFEVIVVVDGSTDGTYEMLIGMSWPFHITIINQSNKGRAGARNVGVVAARADYIVFLDDDLAFDDLMLTRYDTLIGAGHSIVAGAVYPVESKEHAEFLAYSQYLNAKWSNGVLERGNLKIPFFMAANAMFERAVFVDLGMFDERLRDAEDFDLATKIFKRELPIFFEPDIIAGHHITSGFVSYVRRLIEYEKAKHALVEVNLDAAKFLTFKEPEGGKKFLYTTFASKLWIRTMDWGILRIFPKPFRFRLYDFLLTAYMRKKSRTP